MVGHAVCGVSILAVGVPMGWVSLIGRVLRVLGVGYEHARDELNVYHLRAIVQSELIEVGSFIDLIVEGEAELDDQLIV